MRLQNIVEGPNPPCDRHEPELEYIRAAEEWESNVVQALIDSEDLRTELDVSESRIGLIVVDNDVMVAYQEGSENLGEHLDWHVHEDERGSR